MSIKDQILLVPVKDYNVTSFMLSLKPTLYLKFSEISGNIINYGSDGNTGTVTACTQGQVGQLGMNEAYLFDGATSVVSFLNASLPATKALTTQRYVFLFKPNTMGEGGSTSLLFWTSAIYRVALSTTLAVFASVDLNTTDANVGTNNNQIDFIGSWTLLFMDYDDSNVMGLGRRIRIFRATATKPVTKLTLATDTAGVGVVVPSGNPLYLGNNALTSATMDGLYDFVSVGSGLWTPATAPTDFSTMNYIRSIVFGV
jgi:hypothetical protein